MDTYPVEPLRSNAESPLQAPKDTDRNGGKGEKRFRWKK